MAFEVGHITHIEDYPPSAVNNRIPRLGGNFLNHLAFDFAEPPPAPQLDNFRNRFPRLLNDPFVETVSLALELFGQ